MRSQGMSPTRLWRRTIAIRAKKPSWGVKIMSPIKDVRSTATASLVRTATNPTRSSKLTMETPTVTPAGVISSLLGVTSATSQSQNGSWRWTDESGTQIASPSCEGSLYAGEIVPRKRTTDRLHELLSVHNVNKPARLSICQSQPK